MEYFKHHSAFEKEKQVQSYLFPNVCFHCRKSYKKPKTDELRVCPECGKKLTQLSRKFSAPPKAAVEEWKVVEYLVSQGFRYHTIHIENGQQVKYPKTMKEALEFARVHRTQSTGDVPL
jgi:predicted amidophosphoribosyltransferase